MTAQWITTETCWTCGHPAQRPLCGGCAQVKSKCERVKRWIRQGLTQPPVAPIKETRQPADVDAMLADIEAGECVMDGGEW